MNRRERRALDALTPAKARRHAARGLALFEGEVRTREELDELVLAWANEARERWSITEPLVVYAVRRAMRRIQVRATTRTGARRAALRMTTADREDWALDAEFAQDGTALVYLEGRRGARESYTLHLPEGA